MSAECAHRNEWRHSNQTAGQCKGNSYLLLSWSDLNIFRQVPLFNLPFIHQTQNMFDNIVCCRTQTATRQFEVAGRGEKITYWSVGSFRPLFTPFFKELTRRPPTALWKMNTNILLLVLLLLVLPGVLKNVALSILGTLWGPVQRE